MRQSLFLLALFISVLVAALAWSDAAALPKVLIIGDSISIGYTPFVQQQLAGQAIVEHNPGNAQDTRKGLAELDSWLAGKEYDLIHFNWGLWDLRRDPPEEDDTAVADWAAVPVRVPLDEYLQNLERLVARLEQTGATLIWGSTSRVPDGGNRRIAGDEVIYNAAAAKIMAKHGIATDDLHAFTAALPAELSTSKGNVHFTDPGYERIAGQVAAAIRAALARHNGTAAKID
ncbi:MAG: SGNH/GDSL hydrolase family protein, partial [Candidatus Hydrogenedentes bacterium]|nr:SGNH/GDSL hydrolase family protein [Candidatus Hydrogenedentota bacterium]